MIGEADELITRGQYDNDRTNGFSDMRIEIRGFPLETGIAL